MGGVSPLCFEESVLMGQHVDGGYSCTVWAHLRMVCSLLIILYFT